MAKSKRESKKYIISIKVDANLHKNMLELSKKENRSISNLINTLIKKADTNKKCKGILKSYWGDRHYRVAASITDLDYEYLKKIAKENRIPISGYIYCILKSNEIESKKNTDTAEE